MMKTELLSDWHWHRQIVKTALLVMEKVVLSPIQNNDVLSSLI